MSNVHLRTHHIFINNNEQFNKVFFVEALKMDRKFNETYYQFNRKKQLFMIRNLNTIIFEGETNGCI